MGNACAITNHNGRSTINDSGYDRRTKGGETQMLQNNRDEPTSPVLQSDLNEGQSKEGKYSQTVSQVEPHAVRRN